MKIVTSSNRALDGPIKISLLSFRDVFEVPSLLVQMSVTPVPWRDCVGEVVIDHASQTCFGYRKLVNASLLNGN